MGIGTKMKALRKQQRISINELASVLSKDRTTIYRYENGDIENMPVSVLGPLAEALNTNPEYLLGLSENPTRESRDNFKNKQLFYSKILAEARNQSGLTIEEIISEFEGTIDESFITQVENDYRTVEVKDFTQYAMILNLNGYILRIENIEKSWKEHIEDIQDPIDVTLDKYQDEEVFIHDLVKELRKEYYSNEIENDFSDSIEDLFADIPINDRKEIFDSIMDYAEYVVTQFKAKHKQP